MNLQINRNYHCQNVRTGLREQNVPTGAFCILVIFKTKKRRMPAFGFEGPRFWYHEENSKATCSSLKGWRYLAVTVKQSIKSLIRRRELTKLFSSNIKQINNSMYLRCPTIYGERFSRFDTILTFNKIIFYPRFLNKIMKNCLHFVY